MTDLNATRRWMTAFVAFLLVHASPVIAWAQAGTPLGTQTLGRAYWHVFVAYALAWFIILVWLISMFRRLGRVEEQLGNVEGPPLG
ncbi:MAG: hypothetical protein VYD78_03875 [Gemmatimonadota bacterium]|nr:hypothetical protein [Gemmatimonadota bacterium]